MYIFFKVMNYFLRRKLFFETEVGFEPFTPKPINRKKNVFLWLNLEFNMEVNNSYKIKQ